MSKRVRAIYLIVFLLCVFLLNHALTGGWKIKTGDESIWFNAGLFMLIIGAYWIEHFFTKPSDVLVNSLAVFIAVSSLNDPPFPSWWNLVRYGSLALMIGAFLVVWSGTPAIAKNDTSAWKRVLYGLVVRLGNSAVLFSVVFILALLSYFDMQRPASMGGDLLGNRPCSEVPGFGWACQVLGAVEERQPEGGGGCHHVKADYIRLCEPKKAQIEEGQIVSVPISKDKRLLFQIILYHRRS